MTRLAVAQTLVSGTVTLQGIPYSFTASASGTATADRVPQAKKAATVASNAAAVIAARASIDKILAENSAILSDLEITSLISNNFTTTVRVFKPIALETIATTTDGINYFIDKETTIGKSQWLKVTNGKTLSFNAPCKNYGYVQIGDGTGLSSTSNYTKEFDNYYVVFTNYGDTTNIYSAFNNRGDASALSNLGRLNIQTGGYVYNAGKYSAVKNYPAQSAGQLNGYLDIYPNAHIQNSGYGSFVYGNGDVNNQGSVYCSPAGDDKSVSYTACCWTGPLSNCRNVLIE
jgi:hypothetical protein